MRVGRQHAVLGGVLLLLAAPAFAVGIAPLRKEVRTARPVQAFWLTVINPYPQPKQFRAFVEPRDKAAVAAPPVRLVPETMAIAARGQRRMLVVVQDLAPGETRDTRVCAELMKQEGMIHARVCSTLVAHRLAART